MAAIARKLAVLGASGAPAQRVEARASARLAFGLVEDRESLAALEADWSALFERCGKPHQVFQTFEWLAIWSLHYLGPCTKLSIVTGHVDGRLAMIWPLVTQSRFGLRILSFMGDPVSQYGDAIIDPALSDADLDAAFDYVKALPVALLAFRRVRADAAIAPLLRRRLGDPVNVQHAPYVNFEGVAGIEAFEKRYSGKVRSNRRRHVRRLEDKGPVRFEHHGPSPQAMALVPIALAFKRDWVRRTGAVAPAIGDPRFEQFFLTAASGTGACPPLRVSAVYCADDIVGVEISVACKGRLFGHVLSSRPGLERPGIGGILAGRAIISALEQGYDSYDTLAPSDAYKLEWTSLSVAVGDYAGGSGLIGVLYKRLWLNHGRRMAKTVLQTLRGPVRRAFLGRPEKTSEEP